MASLSPLEIYLVLELGCCELLSGITQNCPNGCCGVTFIAEPKCRSYVHFSMARIFSLASTSRIDMVLRLTLPLAPGLVPVVKASPWLGSHAAIR
jgi:hypothetical protein